METMYIEEFEKTGYISWINANIYPDGRIYTREYTEWLEKKALSLEAENKELRGMLSDILPMFTELDSQFGKENSHEREWTETEIDTVNRISELLNKQR